MDRILNKNNTSIGEKNDYELYVESGHSGSISSLAITSDGKYIVSGSDDKTMGYKKR